MMMSRITVSTTTPATTATTIIHQVLQDDLSTVNKPLNVDPSLEVDLDTLTFLQLLPDTLVVTAIVLYSVEQFDPEEMSEWSVEEPSDSTSVDSKLT